MVLSRSSDVVVELPLADEILYLILEFIGVVGVMSYVTVVATILVLVPLCSLLRMAKSLLMWTCPWLA